MFTNSFTNPISSTYPNSPALNARVSAYLQGIMHESPQVPLLGSSSAIGDSLSPASFPSTVGSHLPSHPHTHAISVSNASVSAIDVPTSDDIEKLHWVTLDGYYKTYYFTCHIFADVINVGKIFFICSQCMDSHAHCASHKSTSCVFYMA